MRPARPLVPLGLAALLLFGCDDADPDVADGTEQPDEGTTDAPSPEQPDDADGPVEVEPADVELVYPGAEPRRPLRLDLDEGSEVPATLTFHEEAGDALDDPDAPPSGGVIELLVTVTAATDAGATVAFTYEDVALEGQPGQPSAPMEGIEGELVLDDRSRLIGTSRTAEGLDQLLVALPEEEVGVGAVWEIRSEGVFGLPVTEVTTVELLDIDDDELELDIVVDTHGPDEPAVLPDQGGEEVTLEAFERSGTGRQVVRLSEPFPVTSRHAHETLIVLSAEPQGEQRQRFREEITFERR